MNFAVADAHVDLITWLLERSPVTPFHEVSRGPLSPAGLSPGRVRLMVCALYCADKFNGPKTASARLDELLRASQALSEPLVPAFTGQALVKAFTDPSGPVGYCHLVENCDALLEADLMALTEQGARLAGLTHVGANRLADGNAVSSPGGLRPEGRALLRDLAQAGWAVDLAHLAEPGFWEVLEKFPGPVLVSHTGLRAFHDVPRNLFLEQAGAVVERGGLVCLTFAPEILSADSKASISLVLAHIDSLAQAYGPEHLGLGSDFGGFSDQCRGLADCSRFPDLARGLRNLGYPPQAVAGIMGGNLSRFLSALYPG